MLAVVAEYPGLSNQRVSELAGISDQGQISRLMIRLQEQGLVEKRGGRPQGHAKAWRLTPEGEDVVQANPPLRPEHRVSPAAGHGQRSSRLEAHDRLARGRDGPPGRRRPRVTDRTRLVLTAVAELGTRDFAPSNRQVSRAAGVRDQGQISKLLRRLEHQGLLRNSGGQTRASRTPGVSHPVVKRSWRARARPPRGAAQ